MVQIITLNYSPIEYSIEWNTVQKFNISMCIDVYVQFRYESALQQDAHMTMQRTEQQ